MIKKFILRFELVTRSLDHHGKELAKNIPQWAFDVLITTFTILKSPFAASFISYFISFIFTHHLQLSFMTGGLNIDGFDHSQGELCLP